MTPTGSPHSPQSPNSTRNILRERSTLSQLRDTLSSASQPSDPRESLSSQYDAASSCLSSETPPSSATSSTQHVGHNSTTDSPVCSVKKLYSSRSFVGTKSDTPPPKISLIQDKSLLHILVFLTHREILQLRLIHSAFNNFIENRDIEEYLCLNSHYVVDLNVFENNINPSAPMFSVLHTLFPQSLPYYCPCEHYVETMMPHEESSTLKLRSFAPTVNPPLEEDLIQQNEMDHSAQNADQHPEQLPSNRPQRASLIASVYDHFPKESAKFPIIILKRRKDMHEGARAVVRDNIRNALILNATGLPDKEIRAHFQDTDHKLHILQLPKFRHNLKKYAKRLSEHHTFESLRVALRYSIRRTMYVKRQEGIMSYQDYSEIREREWQRYHKKHRKVEQFQTRRAVMYWALMPVLIPAMNLSKHLGVRRGLAAALEDDRGKKPKRVRLKKAAKRGISRTRRKMRNIRKHIRAEEEGAIHSHAPRTHHHRGRIRRLRPEDRVHTSNNQAPPSSATNNNSPSCPYETNRGGGLLPRGERAQHQTIDRSRVRTAVDADSMNKSFQANPPNPVEQRVSRIVNTLHNDSTRDSNNASGSNE